MIMRKWVLFGIESLLPEDVQPQSDGLSVPLLWRIPSFLTRFLSWAARSLRWPAFLWANNTAVATAGDISDSTDVTQAGSAEDEASSHALIRSSSHGTPSSRAIASDLQPQPQSREIQKNNNDIILATPMPQDCLNLNSASSQAAGSVANTNQAASNQHFHKTYIVKAAHVGSGGIEEVKGPAPLEAAGSGSPRIAANHSTNKETEEEKTQ